MDTDQWLELIKKAEEVDGHHFSYYVPEVKKLKRLSKIIELEKLLLRLVQATEAGDEISHWGVAPWYYEELAKLYRKLNDYESEVSILEQYANRRHASGAKPPILKARLVKARELLMKYNPLERKLK